MATCGACRGLWLCADSDMVWGKKLRRIHAGSGADRPGPLPFSVGPGRWKALARSLRHFYSQWGYPLQLKGVAATGQSSHHGIFEAKWTLSDMHYWCSRVSAAPSPSPPSTPLASSSCPPLGGQAETLNCIKEHRGFDEGVQLSRWVHCVPVLVRRLPGPGTL